jgi:hypothetical protein
VRIAFASLAAGVWTVLRAPHILLIVYALTVLIALPFAVAMGGVLREALNDPVMLQPDARLLSMDWWLSFEQHAGDLARTFRPGMLGFAAPLGNISALLDGSRPAWFLVAGAAVYAVVWSWLWGGLIDGFARGSVTVRTLFGGGARWFSRVFGLSCAALVIYVVILVAARLLFENIRSGPDEAFEGRTRVLWEIAVYVAVGLALIGVNVVADYTRICVVLEPRTLKAAFDEALRFVTGNPGRVVIVYVLTAVLFAALLTLYWIFERAARGAPAISNALLVGQLFILGRIAVRLTTAAAEVRLFQQIGRVDRA